MLGMVSVLPGLYILVFLGMAFVFAFVPEGDFLSGRWFKGLLVMHFVIVLLSLVLAAYYAYDVWRNQLVSGDKKPLWLVSILLFGPASWPVYWYYFKREFSQPPQSETDPREVG
jgi:hypothetical protein